MRKSSKIILIVLLVALIPVFLVILILEIYNPFTFFVLVIIPLFEILGIYLIISSQDDDAALRAIRRKIVAQDDSLKLKLAQEKELKKQGVEVISCYSCGDEFIERENVCEKCGAPRPNCIICGLNISPDFDPEDKVIILPCCSIYVHTEHILEWLKIKEICPNCRQELTKELLIQAHNL